ncbi:MAG: AAA family ATPase [Candidatus Paceibacteria bacterium]
MKSTYGHNKIIEFFETAKQEGELSHAYCLVGPEHVGKRAIAENISKQLLQRPPQQSPDFQLIRTEDSREIKVDQIRYARGFVSGQAHGDKKVLIINEAEKMNQSAANAFLKTLEEPAEDTVIFLLLTDESSLPATINSRCQSLYIRPVKQENIREYLESQNIDPDPVEKISFAASGLKEKAQEWAEDYNSFEEFLEQIKTLGKIANQPFYKKTDQLEKLYNDFDRDQLREFISSWQIGLHLHLQEESQIDFNPDLSFTEIKDILKELQRSQDRIEKNINKKIILDKILQTIP